MNNSYCSVETLAYSHSAGALGKLFASKGELGSKDTVMNY